MKTTTITIPIYGVQIIAVLDDWATANDFFNLGLTAPDYKAEGWTLHDENEDEKVYVLLKSEHKSVLFHELFHVMSRICEHTGIVPDPKNDEALAHMQEFIGIELAKFIGYGENIKS